MSGNKLGPSVLKRRRQKYENNYTIVPNGYMRHELLSFKARGILGMLLSFEDGFEVSIARLQRMSIKDGRDAVASGINELIEHGYLKRTKRPGADGLLRWEYELLEPSTVLAALDFSAQTDKPSRAGSKPKSPGQVSTDYPSTAEPSTAEPSTRNPYGEEVTPEEELHTDGDVTTDRASDIECPEDFHGNHRWGPGGFCTNGCGIELGAAA